MKSCRTPDLYRLASRTLQAALLAGILGSPGCFSPAHRIERYLVKNPDRPAAVVQALRDGDRIITGMTLQEVRLILGPPARTEAGTAPAAAIWHYDQPERRDDTLQSSDMWTFSVPLQTVVFGPDHTVSEIISYVDLKTDDLPEAPTPTASIQPPPFQPAPPAPATAAAMPSYRPEPDEINVYGWPSITLQGLTGSGNARSAVISGAVREPGDWIGDIRLDAVYANGVVLEYRGRRAFLRPGESTGNRGDGK